MRSEQGDSAPMGLTRKLWCVIIGLVMAVIIGLIAPWWTGYLQSSRMFADYHTAGATFFLVVLGLLFNFGIGLLWRRARLTARELLFVTAMMFASGCIATSGTISYLIPAIAAPHYRQWAGDPAQFRPPTGSEFYREEGGSVLLKPDLYPLDPDDKSTVAIEKFWEGVPEGEPARMGPWVQPLVIWGVMLAAIYCMSAAAMSIMRKQWVDFEHLSYPIAQVPAEMCRALADPGGEGSIFRSKAFWLGAGLIFFGASVGGFYRYLSGDPGLYLRVRHAVVFDWTGGVEHKLEFFLDVVIMGLVFLVPNRVAFSVWFMTLMAWFYRGFTKTYGIGLDVPAYGGEASLGFLIMGAVIVFVGANIWLSRRHLGEVMRRVVGRGDPDYDRREPTSYRTAVIAFVVSAAVATGWLWWAGAQPLHAGIYVLMLFIVLYAVARVIAQCGLPTAGQPVSPEGFTIAALGSKNMSREGIVAIDSQISWHQNMRQVPTNGPSHGGYLAGHTRGLFWAMLAAMLVTYFVGAFSSVHMCYTRQGALTMDGWFYQVSPQLPWLRASSAITRPEGPAFAGFMWSGVGAVIMALLVIGQRMFFWWPLHPVGLIMCMPHLVRIAWFPIMVTWLAKVMILKFGGHKAYRKARQFAIGAVVGMFMAGGVWAVIDTITGTLHNAVFKI
jgi:hypothetical protein